MRRAGTLILRTIISSILFLIFFVPVYWLVLTAVKTMGQCYETPPSFWVSAPQWENFRKAFDSIPFLAMLKNSIIVTVGVLAGQAITVIPAAYAFARFRFCGKKVLFGMVLATMMIPAQLIFLPVFLFFSRLGLVNSYFSLILPHATSAFAIFMLRQAFMQVPEELIEAARLDKAGQITIIAKIMLPVARPTIITMGLLTLITTWNDYFWPFVMTTNNNVRTLPIGITMLKNMEGMVDYPIMMAGNLLLVLPVVIAFLVANKHIIKAFTYMGDK